MDGLDPKNRALIGGSNMEFISMPLSKLRSKPTTCVLCYDTKELNKETKAEVSLTKQEARIQ
jgi:hypothetical protein